MAKFHYPELLEDEPDWMRRAEDLGKRIFELTQFLVDVLKIEDAGASFNGKVAYHESCHILRGLGVSEQPKKLLRAVKGIELVPMEAPENCCGFGGEFANEFPDISAGMVSLKVERFLATGADVLLLCEPGCLLNIAGYLNRNFPGKKAMHMASFLAGSGKGGNYGN
jgi:L-lactate dehydrogenase complex protein LldE